MEEAFEAMIRLLHVLGMLAVIAAGGVLVLCWRQWTCPDDPVMSLAGRGELRRSKGTTQTGSQERASPLMAAAQGFALYLNPPSPPPEEKPVIQDVSKPVISTVKPPAATPRFKVRGTICAGPPERSMALIWQPGTDDTGRWIKEGEQQGSSGGHGRRRRPAGDLRHAGGRGRHPPGPERRPDETPDRFEPIHRGKRTNRRRGLICSSDR
jgi:hypothetical protein